MKKFIAPSIQDALNLAIQEFACSIEEVEYEIAVSPKKGFFGFGKQDAVIVAQKKNHQKIKPEEDEKEIQRENIDSYLPIQDAFFQEKPASKKPSLQDAKIAKEIRELFKLLPYRIDQIKVKIEREDWLYVEFDGPDCGLLIGEKGYRYHAIHYLLSVWIKKDYALNLRLEIADFLKNKEKRVEEYLEEHYDKMISRSFFQTQPFDPLSASIALRRFREAIPDKYIVMKTISESESVIVVNDFRSR
ncbi:Jag N-terminal domain-containing protein [Helicobacter pametensis]|uniref:Jag N-terminal domain-containing protein n=1 Tax=Helicobacter pametensis TaxID=95149 RepID=UPI000481730F|nr:Jag N-terminal domain-containing protein [Helicobacter pametensis]